MSQRDLASRLKTGMFRLLLGTNHLACVSGCVPAGRVQASAFAKSSGEKNAVPAFKQNAQARPVPCFTVPCLWISSVPIRGRPVT